MPHVGLMVKISIHGWFARVGLWEKRVLKIIFMDRKDWQKMNRRVYGEEVLFHPMNGKWIS